MPPKKQKKQPKNAFYFFMLEWKAEKEEQGQRFSGLKEVSELCADDWKYLPEFNRNRFKQMETEAKKLDKADTSNKFNAIGVSFDQIEREQSERSNAVGRMQSDIASTVERLSTNADSLANYYFYLVHANIYCYWGPKKVYIPCEVAISKFSIQEGVVDTYHVFPSPFTPNGKIPLGYKSEVFANSENVHGIPEPEDFQERMEFDWSRIRRDVRKFLRPNESAEFPPLYTWDEDDSNTNCYPGAVKYFFEGISNDSDDEFRVYSLPEFFFKLYGACQNVGTKLYNDHDMAFPILGLAKMQLTKDVYNFSSGLACDFHEPSDFYQNCSLSYVLRWVFLICEYCCIPLKIDLIPGRHCISTAKITLSKKPEPSRPAPAPITPVQHQPIVQSPRTNTHQTSSNGYSAMVPAASYARPPDAGNFDDASEGSDSEGGWSTVSKVQHGMKNLNVGSRKVQSSSESDDGAWRPVPKAHGMKNPKADNKTLNNTSEITFIDRSKVPDPSKTRILRTGQNANVVSEFMPDSVPKPSVRLPTTMGRGELLARIASQQQASSVPGFSSDDFPAIGAGRPGLGRQAKQPPNMGWGRGFMNQ